MVVATGETRTIPQPPELQAQGAVWWSVRTWFPEGSRFLANAIVGQRCSIWVVSVLGEAPRKLREDAWVWNVSPDGSRIAFGTVDKVVLSAIWSPLLSSRAIWTMGPNAEHPEKFLSVPDTKTSLELASWSPDGGRIAYERVHRDDNGEKFAEQTLETQNLKAQSQTTILSDPNLGDYVWLPDGRVVYSTKEPGTGSGNLWDIRIADTGKPRGRPRKLTNWAGNSLDNLTATADGKHLVFHKWRPQSSVYIGDLDVRTKILKTPQRITFSEGSNFPSDFTNDGAVIITSNRSGHWSVLRKKLGQDSDELLVSGSERAEAFGGQLTPDGAWIIYKECVWPCSQESQKRLMRIPTNGGPPEFILSARLYTNVIRCSRAPSNTCAFTERSDDGDKLHFVAFDPGKGRGQELATVNIDSKGFYDWCLSLNGKTIAFLKEGENIIHILHLDDGSKLDISVNGWSNFNSIDSSADSKGWFVYSVSNGNGTLLYVDFTGKAHPVWRQQSSVGWGISSPDGRRLAVIAQGHTGNMWMIEDF
jgi:Tol biopolymer transport system component